MMVHVLLTFQQWLERTPGVEVNGFNFWQKFKNAANQWIEHDFLEPAKVSN